MQVSVQNSRLLIFLSPNFPLKALSRPVSLFEVLFSLVPSNLILLLCDLARIRYLCRVYHSPLFVPPYNVLRVHEQMVTTCINISHIFYALIDVIIHRVFEHLNLNTTTLSPYIHKVYAQHQFLDSPGLTRSLQPEVGDGPFLVGNACQMYIQYRPSELPVCIPINILNNYAIATLAISEHG